MVWLLTRLRLERDEVFYTKLVPGGTSQPSPAMIDDYLRLSRGGNDQMIVMKFGEILRGNAERINEVLPKFR